MNMIRIKCQFFVSKHQFCVYPSFMFHSYFEVAQNLSLAYDLCGSERVNSHRGNV